jgi:hypothetical protein
MTPLHPRWREFCGRLHDALGGSPAGCNGGDDTVAHEGARAILSTMPEVDLAASIAYFVAHHAGCDCEILLNIAIPAADAEDA